MEPEPININIKLPIKNEKEYTELLDQVTKILKAGQAPFVLFAQGETFHVRRGDYMLEAEGVLYTIEAWLQNKKSQKREDLMYSSKKTAEERPNYIG